MKIGILGDLHLTDRKPRLRTDADYLSTLLSKLEYAFDNHFKDCEFIIAPGDVFDSFKVSHLSIRRVVQFLVEKGKRVVVVFGQHDMRFHSSERENTPLGILEGAGVVTVLSQEPILFADENDEAWVYGASWSEEVPEIKTDTSFNILVVHKMIIKDNPLWEGQTGYSRAINFLRRLDYDLIISGDNHQFFTEYEKEGDKYLVNLGSLPRSTIAQIDHVPHCAVYDTDSKPGDRTKVFKIPHEKEVFAIETIEEERGKEELKERLEAFIEGLSGMVELEGLDFKRNMQEWLEENGDKIESGAKEVVEEALRWTK